MPLAFFRQNTEGENRRFNVKSKLDQKELKKYISCSRFIIVNLLRHARINLELLYDCFAFHNILNTQKDVFDVHLKIVGS